MAGLSRSRALPTIRLHKPSGQARIRWQGRELYLGRHGSRESQQRFADFVSRVAAGVDPFADSGDGRTGQDSSTPPKHTLSTNELCVAFLQHAKQHYRKPDGRLTDEYHCFTSAIAPLAELHGITSVSDFGPLALKAVRQLMVGRGWSRKYINKSVGRIRRIFRFGVENELVPAEVFQRLSAVTPLLAGRTSAPDYPLRHPVAPEHLEAVRQRVTPLVRDLIDLQLLTGTRSGELLQLTSNMILRSETVWVAELTDHKTAHHGKLRRIYFGAKAQAILQKYPLDRSDAEIFEIRRDTYSRNVKAACVAAGVPPWSPHWLRHTAAARLRDAFGLEVAQALLGHSKLDMTQHYAGLAHAQALEAAAKDG